MLRFRWIGRVSRSLSREIEVKDRRVETWIVGQTASSLTGDLNLYDKNSGETFLQVEGLSTKMVGQQDASRDWPAFSKTVWTKDVSLGLDETVRDFVKDAKQACIAEAAERVALFYVKRIVNQIRSQERKGLQWYHQRMFEAFEEQLKAVENGLHPMICRDWLADDASVLANINLQYPTSVDLQLLNTVGEHMASVVRGETPLLEVMQKDDLLNRFYMENCASLVTNQSIADVLQQITFKFPRCNILEIGAGTGGTVRPRVTFPPPAYIPRHVVFPSNQQ